MTKTHLIGLALAASVFASGCSPPSKQKAIIEDHTKEFAALDARVSSLESDLDKCRSEKDPVAARQRHKDLRAKLVQFEADEKALHEKIQQELLAAGFEKAHGDYLEFKHRNCFGKVSDTETYSVNRNSKVESISRDLAYMRLPPLPHSSGGSSSYPPEAELQRLLRDHAEFERQMQERDRFNKTLDNLNRP